jgi:hypothetical protein
LQCQTRSTTTELGNDSRFGEDPLIAAYIDEFIMLCAGAWMTAVGFGYIDLTTSPNQPWLANLVRQFKWMGLLLMLIAVILGIAAPS